MKVKNLFVLAIKKKFTAVDNVDIKLCNREAWISIVKTYKLKRKKLMGTNFLSS